MNEKPIGIFDSGVGGLTVCRELRRRLPMENLLYLGDTARVPYGTKSAAIVTRYALESAAFLCEKGVKLLVVACNTASAVALPQLRECFGVPVLGVIEPGARAAVAKGARRIGVLGTEGTILSGAYERAILQIDDEIKIFSAPCPLFVPLVEEGWSTHPVAEQIAAEYLAPLLDEKIEALVLGCTHYPLLAQALRRVVGPGVDIVDSAASTAEEVAQLLETQALQAGSTAGGAQFYVTDVPTRFRRIGSEFLGAELHDVTQIQLGF